MSTGQTPPSAPAERSVVIRLPSAGYEKLLAEAERALVPLPDFLARIVMSAPEGPGTGMTSVAIPARLHADLADRAAQHDMSAARLIALILRVSTEPWLDGEECQLCAARKLAGCEGEVSVARLHLAPRIPDPQERKALELLAAGDGDLIALRDLSPLEHAGWVAMDGEPTLTRLGWAALQAAADAKG